MPRRLLYGIALLLLLLLAGLGGYYYYWRHSPRYALWQMVQAIQQQDPERLFRFLDLPEIVTRLAEESAADLEAWLGGSAGGKPEDDVDRLARSLARKFARFAAPKLAMALEPQLKEQLRKYLAGLSATERAALTALVATAEIRRQGDQAQVTLRDAKSGQQLRLELARTSQRDNWRVVAVNYADLKTFLQQRYWREPQGGLGGLPAWFVADLALCLIMMIM